MKDLANHFLFSDFTVYFFPGVFLLLAGVPYVATLWGWEAIVAGIGVLGIGEAALLLPVAYVLGAVLCGFREWVVVRLGHRKATAAARSSIEPSFAANAVARRFAELFPGIEELAWSEDHFYCIRAWVEENRPGIAELARRQTALAVLRENLVLPCVVWGVGFGMLGLLHPWTQVAARVGCLGLALVLGGLGPLALLQRARVNRVREVREVCVGVLVPAPVQQRKADEGAAL